MKNQDLQIPILEQLKIRLERIETLVNSIKNQKNQQHAWLTTKQAATVLSVTTRTLQTYRDQGDIPFSQFGREIRFRPEDIQEFLMEHYVIASKRKGGVR